MKASKFLTVALCLISIPWFLTGCEDKKKAVSVQKSIPVTVIQATSGTQPYIIDVFGQTEGQEAVMVYPQVTGPVLSRNYSEGTAVKKGDVLFIIDPAPFEAAYQSAEAAVTQAEVNLKRAQREATRYTKLHAAKAVSEKEYSDALSELAACKANLTSAQAKAKEAGITLGYTKVRAPVDGIAGRALINPGALVNAHSTALTDITQENALKVRFSLSDKQLHGFSVTEESPIVVIDETTGTGSTAKIEFTAVQIDPQTGTRSLSAKVSDKKDLLPGQYVTVRLTLGKQENVFLVPQSAVRQLPDGTYSVYVFRDGTARQQPVTVGRWLGTDWIITSGLKAGDEVIVDQIQKLKDKTKVTKKTASVKKDE